MDSGSSTVLASGEPDRLSKLGDAALGHILSFLPATEAARTATLSRRWRHVFAAVHTLSFGEAEAPLRMYYRWWRRCSYCDNGEVPAPRFVAGVSAALHGRHRGVRAVTAPLRALRVVFDESGFRGGEDAMRAVDGWLSYAVYGAGDGEAMEIDLRLGTEPICNRAYALRSWPPYGREQVVEHRHNARNMDYETAEVQDDDDDNDNDDDDEDDDAADYDHDNAADYDDDNAANEDDDDNAVYADDDEENAAFTDANDYTDDDNSADANAPVKDEYVMPRSLFTSCATLRALRLGRCCIDPPLPSAISLPSLKTLHLTRVTRRSGRGAIQRLVSACPSLVDLTLEACKDLTALSIHSARLRRLALRCCHKLATVTIGTTELRAFEYRGASPPKLTICARAAPHNVSFCAFDFCDEEHTGQLYHLTPLLTGVERLHLTSARLGSCFVSYWGDPLSPCLATLRSLKMTGMLPDDDEFTVLMVARILERTPSLETLSLFFLPEHRQVFKGSPKPVSVMQEVLDASHELRYNPHTLLQEAPPGDVKVPCCLRETIKEINLVHYQGSIAQRALAKYLLCNAPVVSEVCWKVARGPLSIQMKLMEEIKGWVMNKSANMMFF